MIVGGKPTVHSIFSHWDACLQYWSIAQWRFPPSFLEVVGSWIKTQWRFHCSQKFTWTCLINVCIASVVGLWSSFAACWLSCKVASIRAPVLYIGSRLVKVAWIIDLQMESNLVAFQLLEKMLRGLELRTEECYPWDPGTCALHIEGDW
jgi:hypothetical protein